MRPKKITLDKERLYDEILALKMEINTYKSENIRTRTKLSQCEKELAKKNEIIEELSGIEKIPIHKNIRIVSSLKQNVNDIKKELREKCEEIAKLKKNMKVSKVGELEIELQAYMDECLRLKYGMDEFIKKKAISNVYSSSPDEIRYKDSVISTLKKEKQELEIAAASLKEELIRMRDTIIENERQKKKPTKKDNVSNYKIEIQKLKSLLESLNKEKNDKELYFTQEVAKYKQTAEDLRNLLDFAEKKNKELIKDSEIPPKKSHKSFSSKGSSDNSAGNLKRSSIQDSGNFEYSEDSPDKYGISDISPFASISNADPYQFMSPLKDLSRKVLNKVSESQSSESIEGDPGRINGEKAYSDEFDSEKNSKYDREEPTGYFNEFFNKENSEVIQESSPIKWNFKAQEDSTEQTPGNKLLTNKSVGEVKPEIYGNSQSIDGRNQKPFGNQEEEYSSDNQADEEKQEVRQHVLANEPNESKAFFDSRVSSKLSLESKEHDEDLPEFGIVGVSKNISGSLKHIENGKDIEKSSSEDEKYSYKENSPKESFSNEKIYAPNTISRSSSKSKAKLLKQHSDSSGSSEDSNKNVDESLGNSESLINSEKHIELIPQAPSHHKSSSSHDFDRNFSNHSLESNQSDKKPVSSSNFLEKSLENPEGNRKDHTPSPSSSSNNLSVDKTINSGPHSLLITETPVIHSIPINESAISSNKNDLSEEHKHTKNEENKHEQENSDHEYENDAEFENEEQSDFDNSKSYEAQNKKLLEFSINNEPILSGELNPDIEAHLKIHERDVEEISASGEKTGFRAHDTPINIEEIDSNNRKYEFNSQGSEKLKSSDSSNHFDLNRHSSQSENQFVIPTNELTEKLEKFSNNSRKSSSERSQKNSKESSAKQQIFDLSETNHKKSSKSSSASSFKGKNNKGLNSERNEHRELEDMKFEDDYQLDEPEADKEEFVTDLLENAEISNSSSRHSLSNNPNSKNSLLVNFKNEPTSKLLIDSEENPIDLNVMKIGDWPKDSPAHLSSSDQADKYSSDHASVSDSSENQEHPESSRSNKKVTTILDNKNPNFTSELTEDQNKHLPQERRSSASNRSEKSKKNKSSSSSSSSSSSKQNLMNLENSSSSLSSLKSKSRKSSSKSKSSSSKFEPKSSIIESKPSSSSLKSKGSLITGKTQIKFEEKSPDAEIHEKNINPFMKAFVVNSINNRIQNDAKAPDEEESPREEMHERKLSPFTKGFVINSISESIGSKLIPHDSNRIEGEFGASVPLENGEGSHDSSESNDMF